MMRGLIKSVLVCVLMVLAVVNVVVAHSGTRNLAMGNTGVAYSDDPFSVWTNPAGLGLTMFPQLQLDIEAQPQGSLRYVLNYVEPDYGTGAGGLSLAYTQEKDSDSQFMAAYAVGALFHTNLGIGLTVRYHNEVGAPDQYFAGDFGLQFGHDWPVRLGITAENIVAKALGDTDTNPELAIRTGLAIPVLDRGLVTVEVGNLLAEGTNRELRVGVEVVVIESLTVRGGWQQYVSHKGENPWTAGVSYAQDRYRLDYGWEQSKHLLGLSLGL